MCGKEYYDYVSSTFVNIYVRDKNIEIGKFLGYLTPIDFVKKSKLHKAPPPYSIEYYIDNIELMIFSSMKNCVYRELKHYKQQIYAFTMYKEDFEAYEGNIMKDIIVETERMNSVLIDYLPNRMKVKGTFTVI